jgi:putative endonuclease
MEIDSSLTPTNSATTSNADSGKSASKEPSGNKSAATDQRNRARGQWGENLAATHYKRHGCQIVDRNWRSATGELDLVLRDGDVYVFSEVKARRSDRYGPAAAAVGVAKQRRIRQLAIEWLRAHDLHGVDIRFDVVAITGTRLEVITSAF